MTFRSVARQTPPYRPFAEVLLTDEVLLHGTLDATLVGFCFPDWASELDVPGFHFHMLSADHATGGHVYDYTAGTTAGDGVAVPEHAPRGAGRGPRARWAVDDGPTSSVRTDRSERDS